MIRGCSGGTLERSLLTVQPRPSPELQTSYPDAGLTSFHVVPQASDSSWPQVNLPSRLLLPLHPNPRQWPLCQRLQLPNHIPDVMVTLPPCHPQPVSPGSGHSCLLSVSLFLIFLINFYRSIVGIQCVLVSAVQKSQSAIHIHIPPLFWISFPFRLPQSTEGSALCHTVGSHQ